MSSDLIYFIIGQLTIPLIIIGWEFYKKYKQQQTRNKHNEHNTRN